MSPSHSFALDQVQFGSRKSKPSNKGMGGIQSNPIQFNSIQFNEKERNEIHRTREWARKRPTKFKGILACFFFTHFGFHSAVNNEEEGEEEED
jgi:hypothetical protein